MVGRRVRRGAGGGVLLIHGEGLNVYEDGSYFIILTSISHLYDIHIWRAVLYALRISHWRIAETGERVCSLSEREIEAVLSRFLTNEGSKPQ